LADERKSTTINHARADQTRAGTERLYRQAADAGDPNALSVLAGMREADGDATAGAGPRPRTARALAVSRDGRTRTAGRP